MFNLDYNRAEIKRYTRLNNDQLNGVSVTFSCYLVTEACLLTDYASDFLTTIQLPAL